MNVHNATAPSTQNAHTSTIVYSLKYKMMVYFALLFIFLLLCINLLRIYGIPHTHFQSEYQQRESEIFTKLNLVADLKKEHLLRWLEERQRDASRLSSNQYLQQYTTLLQNFINNQSQNTVQTNLWQIGQQQPIFQALFQHLQLIQKTHDQLYDLIQIISLKDNSILISTDIDQVGQTRTLAETYQWLPLNNRPYFMTNNFELWLAVAIQPLQKTENTLLLAMRIEPRQLSDFLTVNQGLGKSGEIVLINQAHQLLIANDHPSPAPIHHSPFAKEAFAQLQQDNQKKLLDYQQNPVFAVYRSLPIAENLTWGLVVKIDQQEVFAQLNQNIFYSLIIGGLISLIIGLVLVIALTHYLFKPIRSLIQAIQHVQAGHWNSQVAITENNEIGFLAHSFNLMIEKLHNHQQSLEEALEERSAELYRTNVSLAVNIEEVKELNQHLKQQIAQRQQIEDWIRKKQLEQQIIFDSVPAFIWRKDINNNVIWMNKPAAELSGVHPETPNENGYPLSCLFPEFAEKAYQEDQIVKQSGKPKCGIIQKVKNTTGKTLWLQMDKVPYIDENGQLVGIIVLAVDITAQILAKQELEANEQRFRAIVNTVVDGILMVDEKGIIQVLNPSLARIFGYTLAELQGQPISLLMPAPYNTHHHHYMRQFSQDEAKDIVGFGRETVAKRKNGEVFPIYLAVSELTINEQRMFTGIVSDITTLKQAQTALEESKEKLEIQNRAYSRFVPREFLSFLGKESIVDVALGDQVQQEMTIMFSDIRNFTALSEKMSPSQNFQFINEYLSEMEPVVKAYHGFIDKYIGDSIMALFPDSADDAVCGGIAMLLKLADFNQRRKKICEPPVDIGIGLHTGSLMLGTIGGQNRMDGTVISDAVNLASRVEGLTKIYGASLLITENTFNRLKDPNEYAIRIIDKVKVKGKSQPVIVFEVLDGEVLKTRDSKLATLDTFTNAMIAYQRQHFKIAEELFAECVQINPLDKAAKIYLKRAKHWRENACSDYLDWVTELELKATLE